MLYVQYNDWDVVAIGKGLHFNRKLKREGDAEVYDLTMAIENSGGIFLYNEKEMRVLDYGITNSYDGKGCYFYIEAEFIED